MRYILAFFLTVVCAGTLWAEPGYREVHAGNAAFDKGDFKSAVELYEKAQTKNPAQAKIDYDLGTAYYKDGAYDKAVEFLHKGLLSDDEKIADKVHFNLANALYQAGVSKEDSDIGRAIKSLEEALPHYEKVISHDPKNTAALTNDRFVKKELARLKKKQEQQKQQQKQQKKAHSSSSEQSGQQDQEEQQGQQDQEDQQAQQGQDPSSSGDHQNEPRLAQDRSSGQEDSGDKAPSGQDQGDAHQEQGEPSSKDEASSSGQHTSGQILSQKEAKSLLDAFDQNEQPKGLLNFIQRSGQERPVGKDW